MRLKLPFKPLRTGVHLNYIQNISSYLIENSFTFRSNNRLIYLRNNLIFCENYGKYADIYGKVRRYLKLQQAVPIDINAVQKFNEILAGDFTQ